MIFTCSWSDFFVEDADNWRDDAWEVIRKTPHHTWQILTKRPERILQCLPQDWGNGWNNIWIGVSVENQDYLHRATTLAHIPAKVRFVSAEPLLGPLDFSSVIEQLDWIIVGGESGNDKGEYRYRECKSEWIKQIVSEAKDTNAKIFVKQLGTHLAKQYGCKDRKAGNMDEWPLEFNTIKVREYPEELHK